MRRFGRGALAAMVLALAAGCGDDTGGGGGSGSLGSLREAITEVPLEVLSEGALISWADVDAATEVAGLVRPPADDVDALVAWAMALSNDADSVVSVPFPETVQLVRLRSVEEFAAELGWSLADVDAFIELHHPPARFFVAAGDLTTDGDGVSELGDGVVTAGEGDDLESALDAATAARPLGRPLRLAEADGLLAASLQTGPLETWLAGDGERLDAEPGIAAVAAALDRSGAVAAAVVVRSVHLPWAHDVAGVGWSVDDGDPVITIALHLTGDDHDEAAAALEEALAEGQTRTGLPLRDVLAVRDVAVEDEVLVLTAAPGPEGTVHAPLRMLAAQDAPFGPAG